MFLSCVLILSPVVLFSVQTIEACAQENDKDGTTSEFYALSAVLMDADNGRILLQKNGTEGAAHGKYHQDYDLYPCFGAGAIQMIMFPYPLMQRECPRYIWG